MLHAVFPLNLFFPYLRSAAEASLDIKKLTWRKNIHCLTKKYNIVNGVEYLPTRHTHDEIQVLRREY
jgi:hypothetical protein